jgi:hypothetical protein
MQVDNEWTDIEEKIARIAFDQAYEREIEVLLNQVREKASALMKLDDLWQLHDFLSARRHEIEGKYDYQCAARLFVFARLVKEGWLDLKDLEGLGKDKLSKVAALARM